MPRPGFVLEVDERTPPLLVNEGEGYRMQRFPLGTKVIYPPDALPGVDDLNAHIRHALTNPTGDSKPLPELLFAGMKLTIAVDDISLPLPPMVTPDVRQRVLEHVIELAARAGVDDLEIVVATALHRRMTASEIRRMVGERVFRSFWPKALYNLDAEDATNMTVVGQTDHGETVQIQKRAADSDLIVYVNLNLVAMDGGHKSVGDRPGRLREPEAPPQRQHDAALEVLHGPARGPQRDQRLHGADGPLPGRQRRQGLPDRDHVELRDVPVAARLPEQAGVGVVGQGPGRDDRDEEGQRPGATADPSRVLPQDRGAVQGDRHQRR